MRQILKILLVSTWYGSRLAYPPGLLTVIKLTLLDIIAKIKTWQNNCDEINDLLVDMVELSKLLKRIKIPGPEYNIAVVQDEDLDPVDLAKSK